MSVRVCTRILASRLDSGSSMQKTCGCADDRAAHGDPLALTTGECLGLALQVLGEAEDLGGLGDALLALVAGTLAILSANAMFSSTVMCG